MLGERKRTWGVLNFSIQPAQNLRAFIHGEGCSYGKAHCGDLQGNSRDSFFHSPSPRCTLIFVSRENLKLCGSVGTVTVTTLKRAQLLTEVKYKERGKLNAFSYRSSTTIMVSVDMTF